MQRADVINSVLSLFEAPDYLEIGVNAGQTFLAIKAATRTAVDPRFVFDTRPHVTPATAFHEVTSDEFFGTINGDKRYDAIYLDGLHTFDQTARDLVNAICVLKPRGVVVIDDVLPNSFHASLPDESVASMVRKKYLPESKDYSWMGDVYKVVYFVKDFVQQFAYATVADNHGQLVMWREPREIATAEPLETIARAGFETIAQRPMAFNVMPMGEILDRLGSSF